MSARKSFDVRRERKAPEPEPAPARRRRIRVPKTPLKERRRQARKRALVALALVVSVLLVLILIGLWQTPVRIQRVEASGATPDALVALAKQQLWGTYGYVLPRNSIFIFPEDDIRKAILAAHPEIAAVSIARSSFTSLTISPTARTSALLWCGHERTPEATCYETDAEGLVFMQADAARVTQPGELKIYGALEEGDAASPVGARVSQAERIPEALRLVKTLRGLGASITVLQLRGDEADLLLESGTRLTYVLGKEEQAAALAAASFPTLALADGSIEYIDLRFERKIYVKRFGEE